MSLLSGKSDIKQPQEREASEARDMTLDCCHGSARWQLLTDLLPGCFNRRSTNALHGQLFTHTLKYIATPHRERVRQCQASTTNQLLGSWHTTQQTIDCLTYHLSRPVHGLTEVQGMTFLASETFLEKLGWHTSISGVTEDTRGAADMVEGRWVLWTGGIKAPY